MANPWHANWLKEGVIPWNKRRKKVRFIPDLRGLTFSDFLPEDFRDRPKASRFFEKINLSGTNLRNADLSNLNFRNADFSNSDMSEARIDGSNFERAKFKDTNLTGVSAKNALFENAVFTSSNLEAANFEGADVTGADFIESNLSDKQMDEFEESRAIGTIATAVEYLQIKKDQQLVGRAAFPKGGVLPKDTNDKYDVFFGTNRKPETTLGELVGFGSTSDSKINYGICEVIIPKSHKIGSLGSSKWTRVVKGVDDRLKLHQIIGLNPDLFWRHIDAVSKAMKKKERPTIFIHGFNNTFEQAVLRAAQIGRDLGIGQGIGLFSWPSSGKKRAIRQMKLFWI